MGYSKFVVDAATHWPRDKNKNYRPSKKYIQKIKAIIRTLLNHVRRVFLCDKKFMNIPEVTNKVVEIDAEYGPKVIMAIITL